MATEAKSIASRLRDEAAAHRLELNAAQQDAAARLDDLSARLVQQSQSIGYKLRSQLRRLSAQPAETPLRGLYLWGAVGRGKTMLMDWFYATLPAGLGERTHFYRFMRQVHSELRSIKRRTDPLDTVAARLAARFSVLCLDEIFVSDIADAMILAGLFASLFRRGVVLVATSNIAPQDLYKDGLQRQRFLPAIDLLLSHADIVHLDGPVDYRLRRLEQAPTYLDSALPETAAQFKQCFAVLAGSSASGPTTLLVEDRPIKAQATGAGMVWFDFDDICEGPRSQNDYIEIARLYHTVFISNVPEFTPGNENAARRFIMLIDEFYDRNVNVVLSAAAAPRSLYHGERLQLEFLRAASRLIEMQTQQYLAGQHRP
ncbi:MAG: cell division protein ZapE [Pseudomonadota bacterium]|nr:cell division protein ZapE [Pseudomonadota bacterium]